MKKLGLIVLAVVGLMACHTQENTEDAWADVNALHDASMEHYGTLQDYEAKLGAVLEAAKEDESELKGFSMNAVENVYEEVEKAISDMYNWMNSHNEVKASIEGKSKEDAAKIIETERQAIQRIDDDSKKAVDLAGELLKELGKIDMEADMENGDHDHEGHDHNHDH